MFERYLWNGQLTNLHRLSIGEADGVSGGAPGGGGTATDPAATAQGQGGQTGAGFNQNPAPQPRVDPTTMFGAGAQQAQQPNQQSQQQNQQTQGGQQQQQATYGERYTKTAGDVFTPFVAGQLNGVQTLDALTKATDIYTTAKLAYGVVDKFGSDPNFIARIERIHPQALAAAGYVKANSQQQQQVVRQPITQSQQQQSSVAVPDLTEYGLDANHPITKTLGSLAEQLQASQTQNKAMLERLDAWENRSTQQSEQSLRAGGEKFVDSHIDAQIKSMVQLGPEHQSLYTEMFDSIGMKFNRDSRAVQCYEDMLKAQASGATWDEQTARENLQQRLGVLIDQTVRTLGGNLLKQNQNLNNQVGNNRSRLEPSGAGVQQATGTNGGGATRIGSLLAYTRQNPVRSF